MFWPENENTRTQDLPEAFHDVGQFYWGRTKAFLEDAPMLGPGTAPIVIPRHLAQDIDTPEDWDLAETMFAVLHPSP
jgi:N-acylneuraminate cytidylyltransferase